MVAAAVLAESLRTAETMDHSYAMLWGTSGTVKLKTTMSHGQQNQAEDVGDFYEQVSILTPGI